MILGRKQLPFLQLLCHPVEDITILSVDHSGDALFPRREQDVQDFVVAQLQRRICHVYLQGGDAKLAQSRELGQRLLARMANKHVEGVIGVALSFCAGMSIFEDLEERRACFRLRRKGSSTS